MKPIEQIHKDLESTRFRLASEEPYVVFVRRPGQNRLLLEPMYAVSRITKSDPVFYFENEFFLLEAPPAYAESPLGSLCKVTVLHNSEEIPPMDFGFHRYNHGDLAKTHQGIFCFDLVNTSIGLFKAYRDPEEMFLSDAYYRHPESVLNAMGDNKRLGALARLYGMLFLKGE